jgi:hypothetical protein
VNCFAGRPMNSRHGVDVVKMVLTLSNGHRQVVMIDAPTTDFILARALAVREIKCGLTGCVSL